MQSPDTRTLYVHIDLNQLKVEVIIQPFPRIDSPLLIFPSCPRLLTLGILTRLLSIDRTVPRNNGSRLNDKNRRQKKESLHVLLCLLPCNKVTEI